MATVLNPFITGRYIGSKYFCDREAETALLRKLIDNGRDVTIPGQRGIGKSLLIEHFFSSEYIKQNYLTVSLDIYASSTLAEFVYLLGNAVFSMVLGNFPDQTQIERFFKTIPSLYIGVKYNSVNGEAYFDLKLFQITDPAKTLKQIFTYLDQLPRRVIVAIDEFQQISEYPQKNTEALLRTFVQESQNIHFIYAGSHTGLITNMFRSANRPFYKSSQFIDILPIPCEVYGDYAMRLFEESGRKLEPDVVREVYDFCYGVTSYVQTFFNELFAQTPKGGVCKKERILQALMTIIQTWKQNYLETLKRYTERQKALVIAIACSQPVREVLSYKFIEENKLRSASSVQSALRSLDKDSFFTREDDSIRISDVFFAKWLSRYGAIQ